jgi:hypothetical protein
VLDKLESEKKRKSQLKNSPTNREMPHALKLTIGQQILNLNERTKRRQLYAMEQ